MPAYQLSEGRPHIYNLYGYKCNHIRRAQLHRMWTLRWNANPQNGATRCLCYWHKTSAAWSLPRCRTFFVWIRDKWRWLVFTWLANVCRSVAFLSRQGQPKHLKATNALLLLFFIREAFSQKLVRLCMNELDKPIAGFKDHISRFLFVNFQLIESNPEARISICKINYRDLFWDESYFG